MLPLLVLPSALAATWTVDPSGAGDFIAIQAAIDAATDGDEVDVLPGTYVQPLVLGGKDLLLIGVGGSAATIVHSGGTADAVTQADGPVTATGLTVTTSGGHGFYLSNSDALLTDVVVTGNGGPGVYGAGLSLEVGGSVDLEGCTFDANTGYTGAHVWLRDGGALTVRDSLFTNAIADNGAAINVWQALVPNDVLIERTTFSGNATTVSGAGALAIGGATLVIRDSLFDGNHAQEFGGAINASTTALDVSGTTFSNNDVSGGGLLALQGGAIALYYLDTAAFTDCAFDANTSAGGGGAVFLENASTADFVRTSFTANTAASSGGAIYNQSVTTTDCSFDGNQAVTGGAIDVTSYSDDGSTFTANSANGGDGGAVYVSYTAPVVLTDTVFVGNSATGNGGAMATRFIGATLTRVTVDSNTATAAGGITLADAADAVITDSVFTHNVGSSGTGGLYYGAFTFQGYDITVSNTVFDGNRDDAPAAGTAGAVLLYYPRTALFEHDSFLRNVDNPLATLYAEGGGLTVVSAADLQVHHGLFHGNQATQGGGLLLLGSTAVVENTVFTENLGALNGGAIGATSAAQLTLRNATLAGNTSPNGGCVEADSASNVDFDNTICGFSVGSGVYGSTATGTVAYGDAGSNSGGDWVGITDPVGTNGNISADPMFVAFSADGDETNDDLHLLPGSPCIGTGDPAIADFDGSTSDMGAYGGPDALRDQDGDGVDQVLDCDDGDPTIYPGAPEIPFDLIDQDCDGGDSADADGDGYDDVAFGGDDCDDARPDAHPGAPEQYYDGIDQDCLGGSDFDADLDGHDVVPGGDDCDDADALAYPGAPDAPYDGLDRDCAGDDDFDLDGDGSPLGTDCDDANPIRTPGNPETWYDDVDEDCLGGDDQDQDGDGYDLVDDCDDTAAAIHPGAPDTPYDGIDADCAGDDDLDRDRDGYDGLPAGGTDCDDADFAVHPGAIERWYDGIDQDCDGADDYDQDADGHRSDATGGDDCNDADPSIFPGAADVPYDGLDADCAGDDDYDADGDGHDAQASGGDDCDDADPAVFPGAADPPYDGLDADCHGDDDSDADGDGHASAAYGGDDCDDADPEIYPGAPDDPFDGVDSGCTGVDESDRDGDGFTSAALGGDDCNDASSAIFPGADDEPYDGIDADCAGDDDFDADADGYADLDHGGADCDDSDPAVHPDADDTDGDGVDDDCDGVADDPSGADAGTADAGSGSEGGCGCAESGGTPGFPVGAVMLVLAGARRRRAAGPAR